MILKKCYLTHNDCYSKPTLIKGAPTGIVVHDTGAGNPWLKRYVQAREDDPRMAEINADLGVNSYDNHWNKSQSAGESTRWACVHAFIGKNAAGEIETYQTLPFDYCCWGVGSGSKGSYNFNPTARLQFEICDDGYRDEAYFRAAMREAQEFCAYLCLQFGFGVDRITDHQGAYQEGYGGNHSDIRTWCKAFGITDPVGWFRGEVQKIIDAQDDDLPITPEDLKEFDEMKSRVAALEDRAAELEKAVAGHDVQLKVFHYWKTIEKELPWAYKPLRALYDAGFFAGESASDLNVCRVKIETLVSLAAALKKMGVIEY